LLCQYFMPKSSAFIPIKTGVLEITANIPAGRIATCR
jgi:hypothetical protein